MASREELKQFSENAKKEMKQLYEKIKRHPLTCLTCIIAIVTAAILLIVLPHWQVSGINDITEKITQENQSRATLAQILGGIAVGVGIYFAWGNLKIAQSTFESNQEMARKSLEFAQEGQITERFTRAVDQLGAIDQLGNPAIEIRLGGIYALERIANESEKDYWPIMEILTAYIRKNSSTEDLRLSGQNKVSLDIQAILYVISRRKNCFNNGESIPLNLRGTCLQNADIHSAHLEDANLEGANLNCANLEGANLNCANLEGANLYRINLNRAYIENANLYCAYLKEAYLNWTHFRDARLPEAHLEDANLYKTHIEGAILTDAYLEGSKLIEAHLEGARLQGARLQGVSLLDAHLEGAELEKTNFSGAHLEGANLKGAKNLTVDQLSKVKTLYNAELDPELEKSLREKYPHLFDEPVDEP
ncbi:Pentapeptide repeat family protein [Methanosarcina siciliae HI350]|uniref:Pentapeptide repeat family protein n=1 Tax=Methanosarcina siciliae HI350 TaxID=1434119 RepID=A0A0E3LB70_9EURY|nr:pentapeptide repeat-containing protein [Methanosarcina siciliae]AKB33256.1 Pentapeptide repeat family protein [Methanosarcina siciliae HI350]